MGDFEHYFNLIPTWAVDEVFILQFTGDSSALGTKPMRFYRQHRLVMKEYKRKPLNKSGSCNHLF